MLDRSIIDPYIASQPFPLVFITVSGAHLYGFHSPDSDYDLRGMHVTPMREFSRLSPPDETVETMDKSGRIEMDIVTHDVRKYFLLLLKRNGYVLEQVYSPLVMHSTREFEELKVIARGCITKHHRHHYRAFAESKWEAMIGTPEPTVKMLLYTYRVLLAGIHLMRTGLVESNLRVLNESHRLAQIDDLIARKTNGAEKQTTSPAELHRHESEFLRLRDVLEAASAASHLPEEASCRDALDDLLVRLRMSVASASSR